MKSHLHLSESDGFLGQPRGLGALALVVSIVSAGSILFLLVLSGIRLFYPFELEWIEGAYVNQVKWIADGHPLYGEPSISFIPLNKTPLYFYVSAALFRVAGGGFGAPRLVSIGATLGSLLLLFAIVARETGQYLPGAIAAGLYAASFRFAGAWMDLAKTDSLFLFLILAAFVVGRISPKTWAMVLSGLLFVAAYYTKQLALPIVMVLAPLSLVGSRGRTWPQWLSATVAGLAIYWGVNRITEGWFSFYTFETTSYHQRVAALWHYWHLFLPHMWPAVTVSLLYLACALGNAKTDGIHELSGPWQNLSFGLALVLASWSIFFKVWTYDNGFMPACMGLAMLTGLGYGYLYRSLRCISWRTRAVLGGSALVLILLQFAFLAYDPLKQLPTYEDRQAGERFVARLRDLPGEVWVSRHGFYNVMAGRTSYLHIAPLGDVIGGVYPPRTDNYQQRRQRVEQVVSQALSDQVFEWIMDDKPEMSWPPYYIYVEKLFQDGQVFFPVTGARSRPESLMRKNPVARGGALPLTDASFDFVFGTGWSGPEHWGRWAAAVRSEMQIALEPDHDYRLSIGAFPFCPPVFEGQEITVGWNDLVLGRQVFVECEHHIDTFDLPSRAVTGQIDTLWLEFERTSSPADLGLSNDQRTLAAGFTLIHLEQQ